MIWLARLTLASAALLLAGCGAAPSLCGCEDGCAATASCDPVDPPCPDDPHDGVVDERCGIWVSASRGDDGLPGTQFAPVKTLQRGVDLAGPVGRVYACAETYQDPVTIPSGVSLHGGWLCQDEWKPTPLRAKILTETGVVPLRIEAGEGEGLVTDLDVQAAHAMAPGTSSIAAWAELGAVVELRRVELRAGDGADGAAGTAGGVKPATSGASGVGGDDPCTGEIGEGGLVPVTVCDDGPTAGGEGGDGAETFAQGGGDGLPSLGAGKGGQGEEVAPVCVAGTDGAEGSHGVDGLGALAGGRLMPDGYLSVAGESGTAGTRAQGGGGGGASFGGGGCGLLPPGGAGGGSGGAGGCGGRAGLGGQGGGASIALVSRSSSLKLTRSRLISGKGGRGGNGGVGQVGGLGGLPGLGGSQYPGPPPLHSGCPGGFGGRGGNGGNGGGGAGGPSAAIGHLFGAAPALEDIELLEGAGGDGGLGGNPEVGAGQAGQGTKVLGLGP